MTNILISVVKMILGMKFGLLILIGLILVFGISLIKNTISGSFSIGKLATGLNPFTGAIQGKLIWLAIWTFIFFTAYQFIMRPTTSYDTDYKNQIHNNDDVFIDQRVGPGCVPTKILWGLIQFGCKEDTMKKEETNNTTNNCNCSKEEKKENKIEIKVEDKKKESNKKDGNKGYIYKK